MSGDGKRGRGRGRCGGRDPVAEGTELVVSGKAGQWSSGISRVQT